MPKTSLGLTWNISAILPLTLKKVTRPVAPAELIPTSKENLLVVTPTLTILLLDIPLVLNPLIVRNSLKYRLWGDVVYPTNSPGFPWGTNSTFSKVVLTRLISVIVFPLRFSTLALTPDPLVPELSNSIISFTL